MSLKDKIKEKLPTKVSLVHISFAWADATPADASLGINPEMAGWSAINRSELAYSIKDTAETIANKKLKIKARFWKSTPNESVKIRARAVKLNPKDILTFELHNTFPGENALGSVKERRIYFGDEGYSVFRGKYTEVPMTLEDIQFPEMGVGVYDINWQWECCFMSSSSTKEETVWQKKWRPMTITKHRLYVTLETPRFPWRPSLIPGMETEGPFALPLWPQALHVACQWARGAKTVEEAASMITDKLFECGFFEYDVDSAYYEEITAVPLRIRNTEGAEQIEKTMRFFNLSKVLERLEGGQGLGKLINCLDCALIVSSLANILGCNLRIGKLQNTESMDYADPEIYNKNRFEVNPIQAIGHKSVNVTMEDLKKEDGHFFSYHAVAWQGVDHEDSSEKADFSDIKVKIFDACVQFANGTNEDGSACMLSAANLELGTGEEEHTYRGMLAADTENGVPRCNAPLSTVFRTQLK